MTLSPERRASLCAFAEAALASGPVAVEPASADASFRSYWRVTTRDGTRYVVMDAPPGHEDSTPWLDIGRRLRAAGLHAPEVHAADRDAGFVLMEDLGDRTYLPLLGDASADTLYAPAFDALLRMQRDVEIAGLPAYSRAKLVEEMELMPRWFLGRHLGFTPSCEEWDVLEAAFTRLVHAAFEQPRVFVHRDYHSRNLMLTLSNVPGIVDFQDACIGPVTYDLVSLLRDCYIAWPSARVDAWADAYRIRLEKAGVIRNGVEPVTFRRWFDLAGLQRHTKVLGIFCRLWYRDGKRQYLDDLPRVWGYTIRVARSYPEFGAFADLLEAALGTQGEATLAMARTPAPDGGPGANSARP